MEKTDSDSKKSKSKKSQEIKINRVNKNGPKGKELLEKLFDQILIDISDKGMSWRKALKDKMSSRTFNKMLEEDEERVKRYARATEMRAEVIADETLEIADNRAEDYVDTENGGFIDHAVINRDRLRVDTRKWLLAKLHPKKYGDKIDMTSDNKPLSGTNIVINWGIEVRKDDTGEKKS